MAISFGLNDDGAIIYQFLSLYVNLVFEHSEVENDLLGYNKAIAEYRKDSTSYSLDEVEKELGLSCPPFKFFLKIVW